MKELLKKKTCIVMITGSLLAADALAAQSITLIGEVPPPAPPTPPAIHNSEDILERQSTAETYLVGNISDEEQLSIELINRARANPLAEAILMANTTNRLVLQAYSPAKPDGTGGYGVDLAAMIEAFRAIPPAPPLAPNIKLLSAARKHSQDMLDMNRQSHTGSNGSSISTRIEAEGYNWMSVAENVYAFSDSVEFGHYGFEVDWGTNRPDCAERPAGCTGMQDPPGHRNNIHNAAFKEIGVGILFGSKPRTNSLSGVGPMLVSQEFGVSQLSPAFITGVVYHDYNGNNFYDLGEGLGNIQVSAAGVARVAVTAPSGGYALPVNNNGTYTVTFSGPGLQPVTSQVTVQDKKNVKLDLRPTTKTPVISGPAEPIIGKPNSYSVEAVTGGTSYAWTTFNRNGAAQSEGAENTNNITFKTPTNYVAISSQVVKSGGKSFHLAHHDFLDARQELAPLVATFEVNHLLLARTDSQIRFQSRLGYAATNQVAKVQITTDNGVSWETVYEQAGTMGPGETAFQLRSVPLGQYAGKLISVRFRYDLFFGPSLFLGSTPGIGWYIDDIQFDNLELVTNLQTQATQEPAFSLVPNATGAFGLQVTPRNLQRVLTASTVKLYQPKLGPAEVKVTAVRYLSAVQVQVDFELLSGAVPSGWNLQSSTSVNGLFTNQDGQNLTNLGNGKYRVTATLPRGASSGNRFYRIAMNQ